MPKYAPKNGVPYSQGDADVICPEVQRVIIACGGVANPEDLVAAAKKRNSPLRKYVFNKNKDAAAAAHYKSNAGKLLRSFEVRWFQAGVEHHADLAYYVEVLPAEDDENGDAVRPGARRCNPERGSGHVSVTTMLSDKATQNQHMVKMEQRLATFHYDFEQFKHLVDFRTKFGRTYRQICRFCEEE